VLYVHKFGFEKAFGGDMSAVINHVSEVAESGVLAEYYKRCPGFSILIAWGEKKNKRIDILGYNVKRDSSSWKNNFGVINCNTRDGVVVPGGML